MMQKIALNQEHLTQLLKLIHFERATKFCEIFTLLLSYVVTDECKMEISQNFLAFSEYTNFNQMNFKKRKNSSF